MREQDATALVMVMKNALAPVNAAIADLNQKVAIMQAGLDMVQAGVLPVADLAKEYAVLRERVAVVEVRAPIPGPPGVSGRDGADGLGFDDVAVEFDGERTIAVTFVKGEQRKSFPIVLPYKKFKGPHQAGQLYQPGDEVLKGNGTTWVVTSPEPTLSTPGESKAWTMSGRGPK